MLHRLTVPVIKTVLRNFDPLKRQDGPRYSPEQRPSFGLNNLEALLTVAHEAKEWIAAQVLKC